jgi:hypothetical protein
MSDSEKISAAANLKQLNALLAGGSIVERSAQGECFWMQNGQILASGSFFYIRHRIAELRRYEGDDQ